MKRILAPHKELCAEEGLTAQRSHVLKKWLVWSSFDSPSGVGTTLRTAYYRYKAQAGDAE